MRMTSEYIKFPYIKTGSFNWSNSETIHPVVQEIQVEVSHIRQQLDSINEQVLDFLRNGHGDEFVCFLNEIDRIAIEYYLRPEFHSGIAGGITAMYTQGGRITFYTSNVTTPIVGYK